MELVERDGLGLVAGFAGLGRLDRKWVSERENVGRGSEGETVRGVPETRTASASPTEEGDACPHRPSHCLLR